MSFKDFLISKNVNIKDFLNLYYEVEQIKFDLSELKNSPDGYSSNLGEIDCLEDRLYDLKNKRYFYEGLYLEFNPSASWDKFDSDVYDIFIDYLEEKNIS